MASASAALMVLASATGAKLRAAPVGGVISLGNATISTTGGTTTIHQTTNQAAIDWTSFDLAASETANFVVPTGTSSTLNRITGGGVSTISGTVNSNGYVYFVNPNGMVFEATSRVSANGFIASTANMTNFEYSRFENYFGCNCDVESTVANAAIHLKGDINITRGGAVAIVGPTVSNSGTITTSQGNIMLVGGNGAVLGFESGGDLNETGAGTKPLYINYLGTPIYESHLFNTDGNRTWITINLVEFGFAKVISITNSGTIRNDGGQISFTADSDGLDLATITNSGTLTAHSIGLSPVQDSKSGLYYQQSIPGAIHMTAGRGTVTLTDSSVLDVSGPARGVALIWAGRTALPGIFR